MIRRAVSFFFRVRNLTAFTATIFTVAAVVAATTPVGDPDVFWIAAAGRSMRPGWAVPRSNMFSFVEPDHPWTMHEGLFARPYAALAEWMGPAAFDLIALLGLTVALTLIGAATVGRARRVDAGLVLAFAAVAFFGFRLMTARPTGMSLVFPLALALVTFRPAFSNGMAAAAVAIEIVWANAHGSFPLGLAMLLAAAVEGARDRTRRIAALACAAAGTVVNPYGLGLHRFVWNYFRGEEGVFREIKLHIREFGTMAQAFGATIHLPDLIAYAVLTVIVSSALRKPAHRVRAAFCLMLLVVGARQARHFEMAGLLSCVLLVPYVDDRFEKWFPLRPAARPGFIAATIVLPAVVAGSVAFGLALRARSQDEWVAEGTPLLDLVRALPDGARTYAPFQQAGLVLFYGAPRGVRVFYDSRNDCYSPDTARTFFALEFGELSQAASIAALDRSDTTAVLVPADHPLSARLEGVWPRNITGVAARPAPINATMERGRWRLFVRPEVFRADSPSSL